MILSAVSGIVNKVKTRYAARMSPFDRRPCGIRGREVTALALGAAALGRGESTPTADEDGARTLETAYALGIRHVDTSPMYGESERRLGIALGRNDFADLTISTKVGTHPSRKFSYTRGDLRWSLQNSLKVLGRDRVDVALIHDPRTYEEISSSGGGIDALRELRDEGFCGNVGLGVHSHEFHRRAIDAGAVDIILTYGDFNIVRRSGTALMRHAKSCGVGVLLGSPMMHGFLASGDEPAAAIRERPQLLTWYTEADVAVAQGWFEWCREREVSMRHLNMRFVMSSDLPDCVLTGAATPDEVRANVAEATTPIPDDVWRDALARIAELDASPVG